MFEHDTRGYPRLLRGKLSVASLGNEIRIGPVRGLNTRTRSRPANPYTALSMNEEAKEHLFLLRKIADTNFALCELAIKRQCAHEAIRSSVHGE